MCKSLILFHYLCVRHRLNAVRPCSEASNSCNCGARSAMPVPIHTYAQYFAAYILPKPSSTAAAPDAWVEEGAQKEASLRIVGAPRDWWGRHGSRSRMAWLPRPHHVLRTIAVAVFSTRNSNDSNSINSFGDNTSNNDTPTITNRDSRSDNDNKRVITIVI